MGGQVLVHDVVLNDGPLATEFGVMQAQAFSMIVYGNKIWIWQSGMEVMRLLNFGIGKYS